MLNWPDTALYFVVPPFPAFLPRGPRPARQYRSIDRSDGSHLLEIKQQGHGEAGSAQSSEQDESQR